MAGACDGSGRQGVRDALSKAAAEGERDRALTSCELPTRDAVLLASLRKHTALSRTEDLPPEQIDVFRQVQVSSESNDSGNTSLSDLRSSVVSHHHHHHHMSELLNKVGFLSGVTETDKKSPAYSQPSLTERDFWRRCTWVQVHRAA